MEDDMRKKYHVCDECCAAGFKERARGPRFAGKKRTATEAII
jgi:hypothetical protein